MPVPSMLRPAWAFLSWPLCRFAEVRRVYDVALSPSDARAVVRGAIGTDPMYLPVMEGIAASGRSEVVGSVDDDGRFQIYIGHRRATGLGLVGNVSPRGSFSRIEARVGWVRLHPWAEPLLTIAATLASAGVVYQAVAEGDGFMLGMGLVLGAMLAGGRFLHLRSSAAVARESELPAIVERLEQALAPHRSPTPTGE
jgi:hypothetical protein